MTCDGALTRPTPSLRKPAAEAGESALTRAVSRVVEGWLGAVSPLATLDPRSNATGLGAAPWLAVLASVSVLLAAVAANASRMGESYAVPLLYGACVLFFAPLAARAVHPAASRTERISIVILATVALYAMRVVREPVAFIDHDEFLHWLTTTNILEAGRLFTPNPLLPVSPLFPGLEIATSALVRLSGVPVFPCAVALLAVGRLVFVLALFLVYEKITGSTRVASVGCLAFMGAPTFFVFDAHYAYESLAVVFVASVWLSEVAAKERPEAAWRYSLGISVPLLAALSVTHHTSAFLAAALLVGVAALEHASEGFRRVHLRLLCMAACAVSFPLAWAHVVGDPTGGYLGPVFLDGLRDVGRLLSFSSGRQLFVSDDGAVAPAWQRYSVMLAVATTCLGLSAGFIRSLRTAKLVRAGPALWGESWLVLATLLTLAYPASILFRLTKTGWEIGNRLGGLSYLGVGVVVAISVAMLWQGQSRSPIRAAALGGIGAIILIGGIISGDAPPILVPDRFKVSADAASIEPMDISAAQWTGRWLGSGNMFASDRINRLLLANYGRQDVATTLQDPQDTSVAILSNKLGDVERAVLKTVGVQYVMIDLRITTALPAVGVYFDGALDDQFYTRPPAPKALLKFDAEPSVSRPFDNGYIIIYDVKAFDDAN